MFEPRITEDNFILLAMHCYDNPQCTSLTEFEEDLKRFGYLKKLFNRYRENGDLKERLIINHIIVLFNLFGVSTVEMLFFKIEQRDWNVLATFLQYLDRLPEEIPEFGLHKSKMELDIHLLSKLRIL